MITRRNCLWLIPFLLIVTFPLWKIPIGKFLAPRGGYDPQFIKRTTDEHNFSMKNVTILQSEDGAQTAEIHAAQAITSTEPNEYILKYVNADIIGENGKVTNIKAQNGLFNSITRRLKLIDNVIVTNKADNFTMTTNLLYYLDIKRKVHCPGATEFTGDGIVIRGSSFDYDINDGYYEVGGRVTCTIESTEKP